MRLGKRYVIVRIDARNCDQRIAALGPFHRLGRARRRLDRLAAEIEACGIAVRRIDEDEIFWTGHGREEDAVFFQITAVDDPRRCWPM